MSDTTTIDLQGRTILITGAGDGLGAALARAAGAAGAEVILLGRTVAKLEAVYDAIRAEGGVEPAIYPLDLEGATPADYAELADRVEQQCGHLSAVVHNAAIIGPRSPLEHHAPLEWARVMQVNLTAPLLLTQATLPLLRRSASPVVLFVGEQRRSAYWGGYGVAKAGLGALAEMLQDELESEATIRVEQFEPGPMRTGMRARAFPGELPEETPAPDTAAARMLARLTAA